MDTQTKKVYNEDVWAAEGDRSDPEDFGLVRSKGWPVSYEQSQTGKYPEREVVNQLLYGINAALKQKLREGLMPWDEEVDWIADDTKKVYSFVKGSDCKIYRAIVSSGPRYGGGVDPTSTGQTHWEKY